MIRRIATAIASYIGFGIDEELIAPPTTPSITCEPQSTYDPQLLRVVPTPASKTQTASHQHKWQRHAQLRAYTPPIAPDVREARRLAVRGLYAVRQDAPEAALEYFVEAAKCRDVDLTAIPGFWDLTRGQMMVAVEAYDRVERYRDMAALDAQIATVFRPQLVGEGTPTTPTISPKRVRLSGD